MRPCNDIYATCGIKTKEEEEEDGRNENRK